MKLVVLLPALLVLVLCHMAEGFFGVSVSIQRDKVGV